MTDVERAAALAAVKMLEADAALMTDPTAVIVAETVLAVTEEVLKSSALDSLAGLKAAVDERIQERLTAKFG